MVTAQLGAMRISGRMGAYAVGSVRWGRAGGRGFVPDENGTVVISAQERHSYAGLHFSTLDGKIDKIQATQSARLNLETSEMVCIRVCLPTRDMRNFSVSKGRHLLLAKRLGRPTFCVDHKRRNVR